jgi:hypothetical protein
MQQFLQYIILMFIYSSTCFGRPHAHHQELNCGSSLWFYLRSVVIAVLLVVVGPVITGPTATATAVELLMMGVRTPETCCAVNKRQDNILEKLLRLVRDLFELYASYIFRPLFSPSSGRSIKKDTLQNVFEPTHTCKLLSFEIYSLKYILKYKIQIKLLRLIQNIKYR